MNFGLIYYLLKRSFMLFLLSYPPYCDEPDTAMSSTIVLCPFTCISHFHDLKMLQVLLALAQTPDIVLIKSKFYWGYSSGPGDSSTRVLVACGFVAPSKFSDYLRLFACTRSDSTGRVTADWDVYCFFPVMWCTPNSGDTDTGVTEISKLIEINAIFMLSIKIFGTK